MFIFDFDANILICSDTHNKPIFLLLDLWLSVSLNESDDSFCDMLALSVVL